MNWKLLLLLSMVVGYTHAQQQVNLKQLVPNNGKYTLQDKPFTGIAFELNDENDTVHTLEVIDGLRHGKEKRWHTNGTLSQLLTWDNSKYIHACFYTMGGVKTKEVDYLRQLSSEWHPNGQMKYKDAHVKYPRSGAKPTHFWSDEGHLNWQGQKDEQGRLTGKWTYFYNSGEIRLIEHYLKGQKHGEESLWTEEGKPERIQHFVNGVKEGEEKHYWENGTIKTSFNYKEGVKDGAAGYFLENGEQIREMLYEKGELINIKKLSDEYLLVMGKVTSSFSQCGGMYRPPVPPSPMGNLKFYVREGNKNSSKDPVKVVFTNWEGELMFHVKAGNYCLASGRKIKEFDVLDYLTKEEIDKSKEPKKHLPASGVIKGTPECYQSWWEGGDAILKLEEDDVTDLYINFHQRCFVGDDPCAQYMGPYPP